jgi:hypothetical protein
MVCYQKAIASCFRGKSATDEKIAGKIIENVNRYRAIYQALNSSGWLFFADTLV